MSDELEPYACPKQIERRLRYARIEGWIIEIEQWARRREIVRDMPESCALADKLFPAYPSTKGS